MLESLVSKITSVRVTRLLVKNASIKQIFTCEEHAGPFCLAEAKLTNRYQTLTLNNLHERSEFSILHYTLGQNHYFIQKIHNLKISFLTKFTITKPHFSQNSHFENLIFDKIHNFNVSFLTKFTFTRSHFWQNSHFWNLIFDKIHIFEISTLTKFTFLKSHFWQKSLLYGAQFLPKLTFFNYQIKGIFG